jgi:hypothetical protein
VVKAEGGGISDRGVEGCMRRLRVSHCYFGVGFMASRTGLTGFTGFTSSVGVNCTTFISCKFLSKYVRCFWAYYSCFLAGVCCDVVGFLHRVPTQRSSSSLRQP